jgi:hypothetical protein
MSSAIARAAERLVEILDRVPGVTVHRDPAAAVTVTPAAVVGPPRLFWETYTTQPTRVEFPVYLIDAPDQLTMVRLWGLIPLVTEALDTETDAVVLTATPLPWTSAESPGLPSYNITVEVKLS